MDESDQFATMQITLGELETLRFWQTGVQVVAVSPPSRPFSVWPFAWRGEAPLKIGDWVVLPVDRAHQFPWAAPVVAFSCATTMRLREVVGRCSVEMAVDTLAAADAARWNDKPEEEE